MSILPCPFCGEPADVMQLDWSKASPVTFVVQCVKCQSEGPYRLSGSEAIAAWNTRPPEPAKAERVIEYQLTRACAEEGKCFLIIEERFPPKLAGRKVRCEIYLEDE